MSKEATTHYSKSKIPMVDLMYEKFPVHIRNDLRKVYRSSISKALLSVDIQKQEDEEEAHKDEKQHQSTEAAEPEEGKNFGFLPKIREPSRIVSYESFVKVSSFVH